MLQTVPKLPPGDELSAMLTKALNDNGLFAGSLRVVGRRRNVYSSSYPSEIVVCDLGQGRTLEIFCKYGNEDAEEEGSHRAGLRYEAAVYDRVLQGWNVTTPSYYGVFDDNRFIVLAIEYLDNACRLNKSSDPTAIFRAASWLAKFHALSEMSGHPGRHYFLHRYDEAYYSRWAHRTQRRTRELNLNTKYPWVDAVCERFREVAGEMARIPPVIVHGECYPKNVVVVDDVLYFVDWQSAALGCGEIDLASLTENWGEAVQVECRRIYASQRWPHEAPGRTASYFTIAQLYWHLRWLGGEHVRPNTPGLDWRYSEMRAAAEALHFI